MLLVVAATERELAAVAGAEAFVCGIGPVDAAAATARALVERRPAALLHVGIAGARRDCGLAPGAVALGSESVYCDTSSPLLASIVQPSARLLAAARTALPAAAVVTIGTSANVGGSTGCDVEAMEGFAVLRAAELAGVEAVEVRAIANEIEEPDRALWKIDDALAALAEALPPLVAELSR